MEKSLEEKVNEALESLGIESPYLNEEEINRIAYVFNRHKIDNEHIGIRPERCTDNPRELSFQQNWLKENEINPGIDYGRGTLQDLFTGKKIIHEMTKQDREIVATVIQWLGSNVGWSFLNRCVNDCGYRIVKKEE